MARTGGETRTAVDRIVGTPGLAPLLAGMMLALLSSLEVVLRTDYIHDDMSTGLLLGWGATIPLTLVPGRLITASWTILLANILALATGHMPTSAAVVSMFVIVYVIAWRRVLRTRSAAAERNATQQVIAETLLEHAARGERARIARELHDVVAHHISMIAVQAEAARLTTPGMPTEGARRLLAIGDTARTALTEMRRLLGVLRDDAGTETTRAPQPGLHQLNELVDEARDSAHVSTRLIVHGHVVPLDPGIQLTAYRIVQEALTNARRHAPGSAVDVELDYAENALHVRIRDNGPGSLAGSVVAGHGLLGMRERAATVGGTLSAGAGPVDGFLVQAALPKAGAAD